MGIRLGSGIYGEDSDRPQIGCFRAEVICSTAIWRVVDRSVQILGGLGITDDTIVARLFREVRPFRIYDGPSEVHRWSIARRILRGAAAAV